MAEPTKATEGEQFTVTVMHGGRPYKSEYVVQPACEMKDNGHWYCMTHGEGFQNNTMKDGHLETRGKHKLCWMCHEHGPEVP